MSNCKSCGNSGCGGDCTKKCIKVYRPTVWRDGQTGIPGQDGAPGVGIVNIVDNGDGTFTIFLSDGSDYTIAMPVAAGKHVTDINFTAGNDTQWELVYDDLSTAIINSPYYIQNQGAGEELLYNQAGHPTNIRSLDEANNNAKILVTTSGDRVLFNVKQYGRQDAPVSQDLTGTNNWVTVNQARYQNGAGGMGFVTKSGGGPVIDNHTTNVLEYNVTFIDAYKSILYYRILHSFSLTYNDLSYQQSVDKKFYFELPVTLPEGGIYGFPVGFFDSLEQRYFHAMPTPCFYDIYEDEIDNETNKIRRYGASRLCDAYVSNADGSSDPGWPSHPSGNRLTFRFPYVDRLIDPQGGGDIIKMYKFEAIGSIMIHHSSNTDLLSGFAQDKNH